MEPHRCRRLRRHSLLEKYSNRAIGEPRSSRGRAWSSLKPINISPSFLANGIFRRGASRVGDLLRTNFDYNYPRHIKAILILILTCYQARAMRKSVFHEGNQHSQVSTPVPVTFGFARGHRDQDVHGRIRQLPDSVRLLQVGQSGQSPARILPAAYPRR